MALSPGSRLGPYEVLSLLGAGGMGEVYRARDPRLGREVAIKVLPPDLAHDDTRRRRFLQEARAASALNHPGIVSIHELESAEGVDFIVMEYVPGRTLDALIRSGLRLGEALRIAVPVADALAAAHAAGIVHRDLKPANVMVTPEGGVKVLDFGLAKLVGPEEASGEDGKTLSEVERPSTLSRTGTIAGTPGYMSPEQVTGGKVDARSDVFAFGALLYEMVTGRRAFAGTTREETLRAVVAQEARPPSEVMAGVPADLEKLILRCLRKEAERRFQHMSDVKVELQEIKEESDSAVAAGKAAAHRPRRRLWLAGGLAVTGALVVAGWLVWSQRGRELPPSRVVKLTAYRGSETEPALSLDGEQVAFSWEGEDDSGSRRPLRHIWVMFVGGSEVRQLTNGPGNDRCASWSPDGRQVAFVRETPVGIRPVVRAVHVVSSQGGPDRKLSDLPVRAFSPLAWTPDGSGVVAAGSGEGDERDPAAGALRLLPVDGTPPAVLTRPPGGGFHRAPAFSPDGRQLAYLELENTGRLAPCWVRLGAVDDKFRPSGQGERLLRMPAPSYGLTWAPDGRSVIFDTFAISGNSHLFRVPTRGAASAERIEVAGHEAMSPFVSPRRAQLAFARRLSIWEIWVLEPGRPARRWTASSTAAETQPSYSPDGRKVVFLSGLAGDERGAWIADADGTHAVRLTRGRAGSPRWSPDGRRIAYDKEGEGGIRDLWTIEAEGSGLQRLTNGPILNSLACWSRDSRWIYYRRHDEQGADIWRVPADGGTPERVTNNAVRGPEFAADRCAVSFDGRTLYYKQADGEAPLIAHPLDGGPERVAADCVAGRSFEVGPDGVYYVGCATAEREQPLYRLEPATGRREVLARAEGFMDLTVSPSGGPILFTKATPGADLVLIENFR